MGAVHVEVADGVGLVRLDDPGRRNALSAPLVEELVAAVGRLEADPSVGALVVTGAPPAFCAGADLSDLGASRHGREAGLRRIYEGFLAVARSPLPTIAAVNGAAVGAGMNLALACDVRLVGRSARFDTRFLQLGLHPGGGHVWMLERIVGPQVALATLLFGEVLGGEEAERVGLAWRCVDDGDLLPDALALAGRAAAGPHQLARRIKATLRSAAGVASHAEAVDLELVDQLWSLNQPDFAERLAALQNRVGR
ncbi:MAG: enoyl-CoA hydratase [Acidimicrobiales bacterium]